MDDSERMQTGEQVIMCFGCGRVLKTSGWFRAFHTCAPEEDRAGIEQVLMRRRQIIMEKS